MDPMGTKTPETFRRVGRAVRIQIEMTNTIYLSLEVKKSKNVQENQHFRSKNLPNKDKSSKAPSGRSFEDISQENSSSFDFD